MEITKNLSGACFKNYRELCAETGLPLTNGKSKRCQFNKLQQEYCFLRIHLYFVQNMDLLKLLLQNHFDIPF